MTLLDLVGVAQRIECWPANQKVAGSIYSQGTCLGCRPVSLAGYARGSQLMSNIDLSLPLFPPPFPSL